MRLFVNKKTIRKNGSHLSDHYCFFYRISFANVIDKSGEMCYNFKANGEMAELV